MNDNPAWRALFGNYSSALWPVSKQLPDERGRRNVPPREELQQMISNSYGIIVAKYGDTVVFHSPDLGRCEFTEDVKNKFLERGAILQFTAYKASNFKMSNYWQARIVQTPRDYINEDVDTRLSRFGLARHNVLNPMLELKAKAIVVRTCSCTSKEDNRCQDCYEPHSILWNDIIGVIYASRRRAMNELKMFDAVTCTIVHDPNIMYNWAAYDVVSLGREGDILERGKYYTPRNIAARVRTSDAWTVSDINELNEAKIDNDGFLTATEPDTNELMDVGKRDFTCGFWDNIPRNVKSEDLTYRVTYIEGATTRQVTLVTLSNNKTPAQLESEHPLASYSYR